MMTKEEIQAAYKRLILPESKSPYHFEERCQDIVVEAYNPMCGDKYNLYLPGEPGFQSSCFHGIGCAVSKASTSLLMKEIEGKTPQDILPICQAFLRAVEEGATSPQFNEALNVLITLKEFDGRVDCILLSWKALLDYLEAL